jgi:diguanylate cyclase (GGDEF)-like protein
MANPVSNRTQATFGAPPNAHHTVPSQPLTLLLVGGSGDERLLIENMLADGGAGGGSVDCVTQLADAVRGAKDTTYDAVLLNMEHAHGPSAKSVETINELLDDTPILIISDDDDHNTAAEVLGAGAQDYLIRDALDGRSLVRAVRFAIERKHTEQRLQALLNYDTLTQLPNRELLLDRLTQAIAAATRQQTMVGLLLLDLDRFKLVNDTMGHAFGDKLLCDVAAQVKTCIRESDTLARLGGDEFVIVLNGFKGAQDAAKVASKIITELSKPFVIEGHEVFVTTSIGISLFPNDGLDKNSLITNADLAMYRAKEEGRNHFQFYTFGMNATTVERLTLENDLRRAVERDELVLHYQPQMDCRTNEFIGFEALVRWQHPELGLVPPARFIPMAEENGMIVPIGEWVLRESCRQNKAWIDAGGQPMVVSVNLSSRQFHQESMLKAVTNTLEATGLEARYLALEITESSLMHDPDEAVVTLCLLRNMGIGVAIDDFGTGYSSLGHLKRFPLSSLKIDRAFVSEITENPEDAAIVRAILAMAHSLHLKTVAEGVETEKQLEFLREIGCDEVQGYYLAKPLPAQEFADQFVKSAVA